MCIFAAGLLQGLSTAVTMIGAIQQGRAAASMANYNAQISERNRDLALYQAEDARRRGDIEAAKVIRAGGVLAGRQRATIAANNLDILSGSALDLVDDTEAIAEFDALTIRNNAEREAFGYQVQAENFQTQSDAYRASARDAWRAGFLGALGGALQVSSRWYRRRTGYG